MLGQRQSRTLILFTRHGPFFPIFISLSLVFFLLFKSLYWVLGLFNLRHYKNQVSLKGTIQLFFEEKPQGKKFTRDNKQTMGFHMLLVQLIITLATIKVAAAATQPKPGCPSSCGKLSKIPFPFGTGPDCYLDKSFLITCNTTYKPPKPFLRESRIPVLGISINKGQMRVSVRVSSACYNQNGLYVTGRVGVPRIGLLKFSISNTLNKFTTVGCATAAIIQAYLGANYTTGCISVCDSEKSLIHGSCGSGVGCCQTTIPQGIKGFQVSIHGFGNRSSVESFNPCIYAFVVEEKAFSFSSSSLRHLKSTTRMPVVLDWAIENVTCKEARKNKSSYACRSLNSECIDTQNGPGYRCNCTSGFHGNPYLDDGCTDINECEAANICGDGSICTNVPGNFLCSCLEGYEGNGRNCTKRSQAKGSTLLNISLGISISLSLLMVGSSWIYWILHKRKLMKRKEEFFQQNGGFLLKEELSKHKGSVARIFTAEELKKATKNYDRSRVIGQGGFGTVYKGLLPDNRVVAIKKSRISDESQVKQFINEVVVLSQINHRNVVKLLGCCLETEVPLLVYEFITNGTLSDHIHDQHHAPSLSWGMRLKIAVETATALAYLHSETSIPIIHRDIKSTNILLDDDCTAKVSDFGASRLIPLNQAQLTTLVQGTVGYLDPEYMQTGQLTEKSDVYSFGVVLAELLTGEKVHCFNRGNRNLAMYFMSLREEDCFLEIFEGILVEGGKIDQLKEVAMLAKRCLRVKGEERPTMKEVAMELEGLRIIDKQLSEGRYLNLIESQYMLDKTMPIEDSSNDFHDAGTSFSTTSRDDSMRDHTMMPSESR